jgi:hypothetical protein
MQPDIGRQHTRACKLQQHRNQQGTSWLPNDDSQDAPRSLMHCRKTPMLSPFPLVRIFLTYLQHRDRMVNEMVN